MHSLQNNLYYSLQKVLTSDIIYRNIQMTYLKGGQEGRRAEIYISHLWFIEKRNYHVEKRSRIPLKPRNLPNAVTSNALLLKHNRLSGAQTLIAD